MYDIDRTSGEIRALHPLPARSGVKKPSREGEAGININTVGCVYIKSTLYLKEKYPVGDDVQ